MKKGSIFLLAIIVFIVLIGNSVSLGNIFLSPLVHLYVNAKNGNFSNNEILSKYGIKIKVKKYKWSYSIQDNTDEIRILFTGDRLGKELYRMADITIYKSVDNIQSLFEKIDKSRSCIKKVVKKDENEDKLTICEQNNYNLIYYDSHDKKMIMVYYPYSNTKKGEFDFREFQNGIVIK